MRKPIQLSIWMKDYPRVTLGFNSCVEVEAYLDEVRVCPTVGGTPFRFAIDKAAR